MPEARRIAVNIGGEYVAGTNAIVAGVVSACARLGWDVIGIRDGFDGLLFPDHYPQGGLLALTGDHHLDDLDRGGDVLGNATRTDPFRVQRLTADNEIVEIDRSDDLLAAIRLANIHSVVSIADHSGLSRLFRLSRKGLRSICIPKSVENDIACTAMSFGFNTALGYTADTLRRAAQAARSTGTVGVVEVLGANAGWLALQSALAVRADAALIPEIGYDLPALAATLRRRLDSVGWALVVVAEGASPVARRIVDESATPMTPVQACLSPMATGPDGGRVIHRSGRAAETVARELQRLTNHKTYPLVLGELSRAGAPSATDRQLGLTYGAAAVRAVAQGVEAALVAFHPPDLSYPPLHEVINAAHRLSADHVLVETARAVGISLGEAVTT